MCSRERAKTDEIELSPDRAESTRWSMHHDLLSMVVSQVTSAMEGDDALLHKTPLSRTMVWRARTAYDIALGESAFQIGCVVQPL
jgi:hypothetical protein